jgi:hypothetical protein
VTAVSPVRENRTPTLHVSDRDAVLLTMVTPFAEKPQHVQPLAIPAR